MSTPAPRAAARSRFTPKVVTANDLREGVSVWLTPDDRWSRDMHEAELIEDEAHAQLRLLFAAAQTGVVVGPYLADARPGAEGPEPTHFREIFRTRGPSNYPHEWQARSA
ncbi:DUF2849 domain-containing protein [Ruixingdingia sedimenti]|uniref:DUF2849 domain-containing protein n=1 Tax=Ruixingdingia sedimenti TaxID=3073604 RepID=A0ABU1FA85_9RHOB|nr:DUF2849 domain-containing protein [Xinfangfangia sp. LG-4]MDR5653781.1 DUF2849 domain-containing protein [Xinfangfangia sp. LG-4]